MKNKKTMMEMNEQFKDCPERVTTKIVDGRTYIVHSHFVGDKDLNEVIDRLAFKAAVNEKDISKKSKKALAKFNLMRYNVIIGFGTALI